MITCYNHPRIEAVSHCKSCKLPVCSHCVESEYCTSCARLRRYLELGYSGDRRADIILAPATRSQTKELMLARLQRQAFDPDAASLRKKARSHRDRQGAPPRVKTRQPLSNPGLLPTLASKVQVRPAPLVGLAAILAFGVGLGLWLGQARSTLAVEVKPGMAKTESTYLAPQKEALHVDAPVASDEPSNHEYRAVYIYVREQKATRAAVMPRLHRVFYAPALAPASNEPGPEPISQGPSGSTDSADSPKLSPPAPVLADTPDATTLALAQRHRVEDAATWSAPAMISAHSDVDRLVEVASAPEQPAVGETLTGGTLPMTIPTVLPSR